ncbi:MAG: transposase [Mucispirillum sp.]|nr:transposase [Mucispirillum sp.]
MKKLNREIRRITRIVGIFLNVESYIKLVIIHLIEYMRDWSDYKYLLLLIKE